MNNKVFRFFWQFFLALFLFTTISFSYSEAAAQTNNDFACNNEECADAAQGFLYMAATTALVFFPYFIFDEEQRQKHLESYGYFEMGGAIDGSKQAQLNFDYDRIRNWPLGIHSSVALTQVADSDINIANFVLMASRPLLTDQKMRLAFNAGLGHFKALEVGENRFGGVIGVSYRMSWNTLQFRAAFTYGMMDQDFSRSEASIHFWQFRKDLSLGIGYDHFRVQGINDTHSITLNMQMTSGAPKAQ